MKNLLLTIFSVFLLSGCAVTVDNSTIQNANKLCKKNEGIDFLNVLLSPTVICNNGKSSILHFTW